MDLLAYDRLTGRTDGRTDGLTKMNSPSDIDSRNATPAGGQNESINSSPVHGPRPAWIEGWPKVAGYCPACGTSSLFLGAGGWVTCSLDKCPDPTAVADLIEHRPDLSVPAPQPNPSAALDLDEIESDFADPGVVGLRKLGTVGTGPLCRLVAAVPALVAEVRRLREVKDAALAELDRSLEARDRRAEAERDAARAEAERLRENAITGNEVYRKLIDALGFAWNAPDDEHESAWVDSEDLERQATVLRAEAARQLEDARLKIAELSDEIVVHKAAKEVLRAEAARVREALQAAEGKLEALREHTLDSNPALRTLHDNAVAYLDAVEALSEVRGSAPLSTTLGWLIRQRLLVPVEGDAHDG